MLFSAQLFKLALRIWPGKTVRDCMLSSLAVCTDAGAYDIVVRSRAIRRHVLPCIRFDAATPPVAAGAGIFKFTE